MSGVNKARYLVQHELCGCICRLNQLVCNSKQKWNHSKCGWECGGVLEKRLICEILICVIVNVIKHVKLMNT